MVASKDGVPISYEVYGAGEPALVFIHGWNCDGRYWREQVGPFSVKHRVAVVDLAGHGHSGQSRVKYTMVSFGEDVKAVTEAIGAKQAILIGHSMGGSVIAEAARLMPDRVIGLIGVDTLENIEYSITVEEAGKIVNPLREDFPVKCREFVSDMMRANGDPQLREWILADMTAAPPRVALSAMEEVVGQYVTGEAAKIFDKIKAPVITVNSDLWPVNLEGNRAHMVSYDAIIIKDTDHFLMMNRPGEFNKALEQAVQRLMDK